MPDKYQNPPEQPKSAMERHAQTIIAGLLLALCSWVGFSMLDIRDRLARIEERQLAGPERDRAVDNKLADHEFRLREMERRK